jgi:hypothetical protein
MYMLVWNAVLTKLMGKHPDQSFDDVNSKGLPFRYTNRIISAYGQPYVLVLTMRMRWPRVEGKKGGSFVGGIVGCLVGPFVGSFLGGLIGSLVGHFVRSFGVAFALLLFMHWHWRATVRIADLSSGVASFFLLALAAGEFSRAKAKKRFGSTYTRKKESKKTSQRTIRATPKIGDFHFRRWWPIST